MARNRGGRNFRSRNTRAGLLVKKALFQYPALQLQEALQDEGSTDESCNHFESTFKWIQSLPEVDSNDESDGRKNSEENVELGISLSKEKVGTSNIPVQSVDKESILCENNADNVLHQIEPRTETYFQNHTDELRVTFMEIDDENVISMQTDDIEPDFGSSDVNEIKSSTEINAGVHAHTSIVNPMESIPDRTITMQTDTLETGNNLNDEINQGSVLSILEKLPDTYQIELSIGVSMSNALNPVDTIEENAVLEQSQVIEDIANTSTARYEEGVVGIGSRKKKKITPKKIRRKRLRAAGKEYITGVGKIIAGKTLKDACTEKCFKKCVRKFTLDDRQNIFEEYWRLETLQRKDFILNCIKKSDKARTTVAVLSRRQFTRQYFLPKNNELVPVCRKFFQATLDVTSKFLRCAERDKSVLSTAKTDRRGCHAPKNRTPPKSLQHVRQFIESLPAVHSHYCRNSSERKYLPESAENLNCVYRRYEEYCSLMKYKPVSNFVFRKIFATEYNIGIHTPKKDKCGICVKFASLPSPTANEEAEKKAHDEEKRAINEVYAEYQKRSAEDKSFLTTSFDLEKVLSTPHGQSILFYYARKYAVYNLTFYESYTRTVFCYLWGESDAKRGCVEICSIMEKYLLEIDSRGSVKELSLFCDNCAGQQKNMAMIAVLCHFIKTSKNINKISLNFLMAGHSVMTADSVHAVIEKATKKKTVYAPSEWIPIITNARYKPFPYNVIKLNHSDFRDWKLIGEKMNISVDGQKLKISEIRRAIFSKKDIQKLQFKIINSAALPIEKLAIIKPRRRNTELFQEPPSKYHSQLPISGKKYQDLVDLCVTKNAIPEHYHHEFLQLPHSNTVRDALAEPDDAEEDVDNDL